MDGCMFEEASIPSTVFDETTVSKGLKHAEGRPIGPELYTDTGKGWSSLADSTARKFVAAKLSSIDAAGWMNLTVSQDETRALS